MLKNTSLTIIILACVQQHRYL